KNVADVTSNDRVIYDNELWRPEDTSANDVGRLVNVATGETMPYGKGSGLDLGTVLQNPTRESQHIDLHPAPVPAEITDYMQTTGTDTVFVDANTVSFGDKPTDIRKITLPLSQVTADQLVDPTDPTKRRYVNLPGGPGIGAGSGPMHVVTMATDGFTAVDM